MIERLSARVIAMIVGVLMIVGLLLWGPAACNKIRSLSVQNKVAQGQLDASRNSAVDAITSVGNSAERERASDDATRQNEKDIRNAEGASDPVNPAVGHAGMRALCGRAAYRDSERCRLFQPRP